MELVSTSTQTPIEIALGIDKDGMTTARKLYDFLGLAPQHFARWCKKNISENDFATENEDYLLTHHKWGDANRWSGKARRLQTHSGICQEIIHDVKKRAWRTGTSIFP